MVLDGIIFYIASKKVKNAKYYKIVTEILRVCYKCNKYLKNKYKQHKIKIYCKGKAKEKMQEITCKQNTEERIKKTKEEVKNA